ncbi:uncharacterized protein [Temnothorax nylanderi]|uniref:uncharacterized protein n=1 Tax=Temnothorax nylanderi TaxID=102681 RepID=UPI003A897C77
MCAQRHVWDREQLESRAVGGKRVRTRMKRKHIFSGSELTRMYVRVWFLFVRLFPPPGSRVALDPRSGDIVCVLLRIQKVVIPLETSNLPKFIMSGEEFDDEFEDELELDDKELIMCVKANPFLYNKSEKMYSNTDLKNLAWDSIGNSLTKKKTGAEAEHKFFQLRQRFGRERRKVIQSEPRSGAGASQPTYTPQWNLYNELMFLTDVIKHRKTTSNYRKKQSTSKTQQTQQVNLPTTHIILPVTASKSNSSSISNLWNEDLSAAAPSISDDAGECSSKSEPLLPLQSSQQSSLSNSSFASDNNEMSPVEQIQKSLISYEKRVPQSDLCAKRKKRDLDNWNKSICEKSKSLNVLAQKVGDAISGRQKAPPSCIPHVTESSLRPDVKAMLTSVAFALQKIPESKQLDFLIAIMQLVKQYTEGDVKT